MLTFLSLHGCAGPRQTIVRLLRRSLHAKCHANNVQLSPVPWLERAALLKPDTTAVKYGEDVRRTYSELLVRAFAMRAREKPVKLPLDSRWARNAIDLFELGYACLRSPNGQYSIFLRMSKYYYSDSTRLVGIQYGKCYRCKPTSSGNELLVLSVLAIKFSAQPSSEN